MTSDIEADVVILGLGVHGSAAAASLSRRGRRVIGLEQFALGHARGSSHGRTRMIRRAYPNAAWNDLVDRAYNGWRALERESGSTLVHTTGGLYAHRGRTQLQGPDTEVIDDPTDLRERMPGFRVPEDYRAVYDPAAGVIEAERALDALRGSATRHGAQLRFGVRVDGWGVAADGVEVHTSQGRIRAGRMIVAAGSWADRVLPQLRGILEVWRILTLTVGPGQAAGMPPALGAFSVDRPEGLVFGIPDADGNGVKIGVDAGEIWDPEVPVAPPTDAEVQTLRELLGAYAPGLDTTPAETAACLYTMTQDKRFVIGALSSTPEIIVASACSGHGFKFGPAVGDALADLAEDIERPDLEFVSTARRGL